MAIIDSYAFANGDSLFSMASGNGFAQSFTGTGLYATEAEFEMTRSGTVAGSLSMSIYAHSGTFGSSSVPTGSPLVSITFSAAIVSTTDKMQRFFFPKKILLANGTNYVLTLEDVNSDTDGGSVKFIQVGADTSSPTHAGSYAFKSGGTWSSVAGRDLPFTVIGSASQDSMLTMFF